MTVERTAAGAPGELLWAMTTAPGPAFERLEETVRTDVAVIGAGVAGLSTALHLAERGVSVTIVEAEELGSGATGKSGGLLAPDMIRHTPAQIEQLFGAEQGSRLIRMVGTSASQCFELIQKHDLQCDAEQNGFWTPAHNPVTAVALEQRAREWRERGYHVDYAGDRETVSALGTTRYCGAINFTDGGTLNPLAFCRSLAEVARRLGASIFVNSAVRRLSRNGAAWRVETAHGMIEAGRIVLAANGGNAGLHPKLRRTVLPLDVVEYASAPLSEDQQSAVLRSRVSFTDKQGYIFTARYDAAGRLVSALPDFAIRRSDAALLAEAANRLGHYFPVLKDIPIDYLWQGRAWINPNLLPKIYHFGDGALAIQACNGRGLTTNTVLGKEVAAALHQNDIGLLSVVPETPTPIRGYQVARHIPSLMMLSAFIHNRSSQFLKKDAA